MAKSKEKPTRGGSSFENDADDAPYVAYIGDQVHHTSAGALRHYLAAYGAIPFRVERVSSAPAGEVTK